MNSMNIKDFILKLKNVTPQKNNINFNVEIDYKVIIISNYTIAKNEEKVRTMIWKLM